MNRLKPGLNFYEHPVRTSQETHYVSATKPNRLMLLGETIAVYCENHGTHKYTVWAECRDFIYKYSVRTSQETHYVSATKPNRLMLLGETIAVYCENHTEHINTLCRQNAEISNITTRFGIDTQCFCEVRTAVLYIQKKFVS
jgi:hypothetical protein